MTGGRRLPRASAEHGDADTRILIFSRIPDFLLEIDDPRLAAGPGAGMKGCPICGGECSFLVQPCRLDCQMARSSLTGQGLGHGISNCPKLEEHQRRQQADRTKYTGGGY